jgi:hypothetical protein
LTAMGKSYHCGASACQRRAISKRSDSGSPALHVK